MKKTKAGKVLFAYQIFKTPENDWFYFMIRRFYP